MRLGVVVPSYNEADVLFETADRLIKLFKDLTSKRKINEDSKIYFVDDGSKDNTWRIIEKLVEQSSNICGIKLSRNYGHQHALLAGLFAAEGDALISIDADLQDDINIIENMVDDYIKGCEIVYAVRKQRNSDTKFKELTAKAFYKLMLFMGVELIYNHADYRLMSRRAVDYLKQYKEVYVFLRGIIPLIGFKTSQILYNRAERYAGETKYPLKRMLAFALNGITSFSIKPLRLISIMGFITFFITILLAIWVLFIKLMLGEAIPGWASTLLAIFFIGGIQILSIGILGEYLGKIYGEVKARPRYIVEKIID